jgi:hypothetical protein
MRLVRRHNTERRRRSSSRSLSELFQSSRSTSHLLLSSQQQQDHHHPHEIDSEESSLEARAKANHDESFDNTWRPQSFARSMSSDCSRTKTLSSMFWCSKIRGSGFSFHPAIAEKSQERHQQRKSRTVSASSDRYLYLYLYCTGLGGWG